MKRKILNPFIEAKSDYNCIGCSPRNEHGLKLQFYEEDGCICSEWMPDKGFEGYVNVVHGGIQATLLDEVAAWLVYTQCRTAGVTKSMTIEYRQPVYMNGAVKVKTQLLSRAGQEVEIFGQLFSSDGKLCTEATIRYFIYPESIARRRYMYPGHERFFE